MSSIDIDPSDALQGRRALVVDDQEIIRKMLERLLYRLGFEEVLEATDGSDALKVLDRRGFDARRARTPVLFLTGSADKDHILGARGLGVKDYLLKPIDPEKLRARLVKMFA